MQQEYDPRNKDIKVWIDGVLYPREEARISVFDSVVQGGDAVWEGLRVYDGLVYCMDRHLRRLSDSAHAMLFDQVPSELEITEAVFETLRANTMYDDTHIRLTLTRGKKITSGMDPRLNQSGCTLIILAEWKPPVYDNVSGIHVITSSIRRNAAQHLDSKIHHNNLVNNILAKIQANHAGADAALMLDVHGFASELNGTNIFMVRDDVIYTPHADACLPGITRGVVMELAAEMGMQVMEKHISLTELYAADEVFATGTMGELTPIRRIDGREIRNPYHDACIKRLRSAFKASIPRLGVKIP